jgi:hypothetical protein
MDGLWLRDWFGRSIIDAAPGDAVELGCPGAKGAAVAGSVNV